MTSNDSVEVAEVINLKLWELYSLDVETTVKCTISDTAPAARNVSRQFDTTLQTDCAMHCLNLCIGYGVGLKENTQSQTYKCPKTKVMMKRQIIVTVGGEFREGSNVIRKLRELNKYFTSSLAVQRQHALTKVQKSCGLPELGGLIDVDVRVV
ncbi:hypothetical protein ON010_g18113 [Phytophthora cinnamomi]|nr:hypothetical protein ON010_g18113 [Phytophthora cinnamomi]